MTPTADEVVALLGLEPHPEGGAFRETFRDAGAPEGRGASTAIYYLLREGERSHWHRIDAAEVWHHYAGAPLLLRIEGASGIETHRLGSALTEGERPQAVVPPHAWQSAETTGAWSLVGCTVAPGFDFGSFELAPEGFTPPS